MAERNIEKVIFKRGGKQAYISKPTLMERFGMALAGLRATASEKEFFRRRTINDVTKEPLADPYGQHPVVRACIDAIKDNVAGVPWCIYKETGNSGSGERRRLASSAAFNQFNQKRFMNRDGQVYARYISEEDYEVVESGELVDLFTSPNPVTPSTSLFWEATIMYMLRDGECVTVAPERENVAQIPKMLFPKPPYSFRPNIDENTGYPLTWQWVTPKGKTKTLKDEQLIRPRLPNPNDLLRGIAPYASGKIGTETDWYAMLFNKNFFQNGAQLGGLVLGPPGMTNEQRKIALEAFNTENAGVDQAFGVWLVSGANDFKELGVKHRDMHFHELRKYSREELAMLYRVPLTILSVYEQVNYANARVQDKAFWRYTLIPIIRHIEELYWASLFRWVEGGKYWGAFDLTVVEALQEDLAGKLANAKLLFDMGWPINKINKRMDLGMEDVAWGDTSLVPLTLIPAEEAASGSTLPPETEDQGQANEQATVEEPAGARAIPLSKPKRELFWRDYIKFLKPFENRFNTEYKKYLFKLRKVQLKKVSAYEQSDAQALAIQRQGLDETTAAQVAELLLFNQEKWDNALTQTARPVYVSSMLASGERLSKEIGGAGLYDVTDPEFASALAEKEHKLKGTNVTLRNNLKVQLVEGLTAGETTNQLQDRIRSVFNFHESRSLTVARTEIGQATEAARFGSMKAEGVPGIWWLTAGDENVRTSHVAAMAEGVIPLGQAFAATQCRYPLDMAGPANEIINCRCVGMPAEAPG